MRAKLKSGREVELTDFEHSEDPCDSFICKAYYADVPDDIEVTDAEYEELNETCRELINRSFEERAHGYADFIYDQWKEGNL